jgi:hypothetical protein
MSHTFTSLLTHVIFSNARACTSPRLVTVLAYLLGMQNPRLGRFLIAYHELQLRRDLCLLGAILAASALILNMRARSIVSPIGRTQNRHPQETNMKIASFHQ